VPHILGAIFDLDGTLVDSALDFDLMRREMGIRGRTPLLEAIGQMTADDATRCWAILDEHERRGAERAVAYPGVADFLARLASRGIARAVVTRNSRSITLPLLARLGLAIDLVVGREDAPVKPDPAAIWKICDAWGVRPSQCVMIGDFRFDIEAARRAGTHAVLFTGGGGPHGLDSEDLADHVLASFAEPAAFWAWFDQIDLPPSQRSC
jgi:HAD superfamily hydrolase (TIGR01509 family)